MATHQAHVSGELRSSLSIMGCTGPGNHITSIPGVGATLSRPPSRMPDYDHIVNDNTPLPIEASMQSPSNEGHGQEQHSGVRPYLHFIVSISLIAFSLLSITATGAIMTILNQIGKPVPVGYSAWLIVSIAVLVFSLAGLGLVLYGSPKALPRACIPRQPLFFRWTLHWPSFRWPVMRFPTIRKKSTAQLPSRLPDPEEFELDDLERQPRRPPTPYPGPARPVPTIAQQSSFKDSHYQTLPLGFPVPPSGRPNRISSRVSGMSRISFQSAPRSVSPLSDTPPTPPPKEETVSRFQSRELLLPPAVSGETVAVSETRASILTELCDAVQLSNPEGEPGPAAQNYSPLATVSSATTGNTGTESTLIQYPKPTFQIKLASPSRGRANEP